MACSNTVDCILRRQSLQQTLTVYCKDPGKVKLQEAKLRPNFQNEVRITKHSRNIKMCRLMFINNHDKKIVFVFSEMTSERSRGDRKGNGRAGGGRQKMY